MATHFSLSLHQALNELAITQLDFAKAIGASHSLITKLLAGEDAHRKTYAKVFGYFTEQPDRVPIAKRLLKAYLRDVVRGIGMEDEFDEADLTVSTAHESAVSHVFRGLPQTVLAACYAVGTAAKEHDAVHNGLISLAEIACELQPQGQIGFPKHFFSAALRKPAGSQRLLGGSLGDLFRGLDPSNGR